MDEIETDELTELLLLAANEGEIEATKEQILSKNETPPSSSVVKKSKKFSRPTDEPIDSSDEEDLQNFETKYTQYGREINHMLKAKNAEKHDSVIGREVDKSLNNSHSTTSIGSHKNGQRMAHETTTQNQQTTQAGTPTTTVPPLKFSSAYQPPVNSNVLTDPVFGMRIIQPLVSGAMLKERMTGRIPVDIRNLDFHITHGDLSKDWCIGGVIVNKGAVQTSQKGSQYIIWKISDLKGEMQTISIFLFKNAFKDLWKTTQGMVIAILNPSIFPRKDGKYEPTLSIDNPQKVMILGRSKDFGLCRSKKKNGEPCSAIVNLGICEYCVYHVKQEYGKLSKRSELQSATSGRGLKALQNKILGKNEVFYAGKSFVAEPTPTSKKHIVKDQQRLMSLSDHFKSSSGQLPAASRSMGVVKSVTAANPRISKIAEAIESTTQQRCKDLERLKLLGCTPPSITNGPILAPKNKPLIENKPRENSLLDRKFSSNLTASLSKVPSLSKNDFSFTVDFNSNAKSKAIEILKNKPIEKSNPNFIKYRGTESGKKRVLEQLSREESENEQKKRKMDDTVDAAEQEHKDRIQRILNASSSHTELIKAHELSVQDEYFGKLEKKELMEEKMLNTKKVDCKAVICLTCKYKAFSAAPRCKDEKHPLKVIDAEKRFYECEDCGNRVTTLFRIPKQSCSNCQSSKWKRAGMIREKKCTIGLELSVRGDEEVFLGSLQSKANVNLCVSVNDD